MIKVYATVGVQNNLITTIPFKGAKVRVEFTGGNSMKNIPAKLYTRDPFVMKALDSSDQLGRLYRVYQTLNEEGDEEPGRQPDGKTPATAAERQPDGKTPATAAERQPDREASGTTAVPAGESPGTVAGDSGQKIEFDNLAEAITYIASVWGDQVENESQARRYIEEKTGIKPIIHRDSL